MRSKFAADNRLAIGNFGLNNGDADREAVQENSHPLPQISLCNFCEKPCTLFIKFQTDFGNACLRIKDQLGSLQVLPVKAGTLKRILELGFIIYYIVEIRLFFHEF